MYFKIYVEFILIDWWKGLVDSLFSANMKKIISFQSSNRSLPILMQMMHTVLPILCHISKITQKVVDDFH